MKTRFLALRKPTTVVLGLLVLFMLSGRFPAILVSALDTANVVVNPGFEVPSSSAWFALSQLQNGTVNPNSQFYNSGAHSAMLSAVNRSLQCPTSDCKDTVRAMIAQFVTSPSVSDIVSGNTSFTAWLFVAPSSFQTYSIHFGLSFSDRSAIEYWYGISDLNNTLYYVGPIPPEGSWFELSRNLSMDIQGAVSDPSATITGVWFGAFGGTYQGAPRGETVWLDDVSLMFKGGPTPVFSSSQVQGSAPLTVSFDASRSYETRGFAASIVQYQWDFGDGSPSLSGPSPTIDHTFSSAGAYNVTLTLVDSNGVVSSPAGAVVRVSPADSTLPVLVGLGIIGLIAVFLIVRRARRSSRSKSRRMD